MAKLDLTVETRLGQRRRQWSAMTQGTHERRNYPSPCDIIIRDQVTNRHHTMQGQAQNQDLVLRGEPAT